MRVALAHDWMTTYAGSERVVEQMLSVWPDARLLTAVYARDRLPEPLRRAEPSLLQRLPRAERYHRLLLPAMPAAWRLRAPIRDVDAVVASSHACANAVRVGAGIPVLSYCHTPMRYAWDFGAERDRVFAPLQPGVAAVMAAFRAWDRRTAGRITRFVANSRAVADRIRRFYGRSSQVVHPPVRTDFFTPGGERGDEFVYVGRLVSYKRPDLAVAAFAGLATRLLVVGEGRLAARLRASAPPNVRFLGEVSTEELRAILRRSRALVFPGEEDFGITMAEAQACGTPVVAFRGGGALDIVEDGVSGWLAERQTADDVRRAVLRALAEELDGTEIRRRAERFSHLRFREEIRDAVAQMVDDERTRSPSAASALRARGAGD
ncbi:MAG: glycosyltransferase [Thermoleophilia bacterium]|nr:glycosyltransferase [Thermoleophilia bacterium]